MSQRSRLLIYERKEVILLGVLSLLVAVFAFTFGIHLGKRVPPKGKPATHDGSAVGHVNQISDQEPTRAEAQEKVPEAKAVAGQILDQTLKEEVSSSGLQLEKPVQVKLPKKTITEKKVILGMKGTTGKKVVPENTQPTGDLASALARNAPSGAFTVQILAAPASESERLGKSLARFSAAGLEPWARRAEIAGKGSWIRLYQGGFASRELAEKSAAGWKAAGTIDSYVVAKSPPKTTPSASGEHHE